MSKTTNNTTSIDESFDKRSTIKAIRGEDKTVEVYGTMVGKITAYEFKIFIRDKEPLQGTLSREEVDLMYRLYSSEGSNLSQRTVSRYFPNYTFQDFKKILRTFGITKAVSPVAPHVMEEKPIDELITLTLQNKENDFLRKLEQDRTRLTEGKLREMTGKYFGLKQQIADFKDFLAEIKLDITVQVRKPNKTSKKALIVYLSDMHIGADVSKSSIYENEFTFETARKRLEVIANRIMELSSSMGISNIIVCNIGDTLDGYNGETTRGGHALPQNMNNKEQFKNYLKMMSEFFADLSSCGYFDSISYFAVEGGNHDGDFGYMANKALEGILAILNPEIEVTVFEKYIEYFKVLGHTFVLCHGKDAKDVFKNMPLVINDKTENQINEFLDYNNIHGKNIHFVKGDLHQSATTYSKRFRYKSVASFFGSSEWIHKNFGNTKAAIDFDVIDGDNILETRIILN